MASVNLKLISTECIHHKQGFVLKNHKILLNTHKVHSYLWEIQVFINTNSTLYFCWVFFKSVASLWVSWIHLVRKHLKRGHENITHLVNEQANIATKDKNLLQETKLKPSYFFVMKIFQQMNGNLCTTTKLKIVGKILPNATVNSELWH